MLQQQLPAAANGSVDTAVFSFHSCVCCENCPIVIIHSCGSRGRNLLNMSKLVTSSFSGIAITIFDLPPNAGSISRSCTCTDAGSASSAPLGEDHAWVSRPVWAWQVALLYCTYTEMRLRHSLCNYPVDSLWLFHLCSDHTVTVNSKNLGVEDILRLLDHQ